MLTDITAVIPFCSYDKPYFKLCIDNLLSIGIECIVVTYDHLYAGEPENTKVLKECQQLYADNNNYKQINLRWKPGKPSIYWESLARYNGLLAARESSKYILYIDIDEIVDPIKAYQWFKKGVYTKYAGMKLRSYTYTLTPNYRLRGKHYNTVICRKGYALGLGHKVEARLQFFNNTNKLSRWTAKLGINPFFAIYSGEPFIHHYTSVRTIENMLTKVRNWSHNKDRSDWENIVLNTKLQPNNKINGMKIKIVEDKFNLYKKVLCNT
jgi:hypothetical protein